MLNTTCAIGVVVVTIATLGLAVFLLVRKRRTGQPEVRLLGPPNAQLIRNVEELMLQGRLEPLAAR